MRLLKEIKFMSLLSSYSTKKITPKLEGLRVVMRPPEYRDWKLWADQRKKNMNFLKPWEPSWSPNDLERSSFLRRIKAFEKLIISDDAYPFFIFDRNNDNLIGEININNIQRGVLQSCSIGYWISEDRMGLGFMSESISLIKDFIFNELDLHRIEAACLSSNKPSLSLLKKNGFQYEGTARKLIKINGKWKDHMVLSYIVDDY
tara:strand:+ start:454 stop:1062 length:609 start_codon:yes stop_codon:yes gene_type:complete